MAWRLKRSVVKGYIDNRTRGLVTGQIWLLGSEKPVMLSLDGDCLRDIAGSRIVFQNPDPQGGDNVNLEPVQEGVAGDMTASRKVRVLTVPAEVADALREAGQDVPGSIGNCLYLEWYSETNGHVVLESTDYSVEISEHVWQMSREEEIIQSQANHEAAGAWLEHLAGLGEMKGLCANPFSPSCDDINDEFKWEQSLKETDALNDRFAELLDHYADHPDRELLVARDMGWDWIEKAIDAQSRGELVLNPEDQEDAHVEPDPMTQGKNWVRTPEGDITHPLTLRALRLAENTWQYCDNRSLLGDNGDPDLNEMIFQLECLSAKISDALDGLAFDPETDTGYIVASLKRTFRHLNAVLYYIVQVEGKGLVELPVLTDCRTAVFGLREEVLRLMRYYRQQGW